MQYNPPTIQAIQKQIAGYLQSQLPGSNAEIPGTEFVISAAHAGPIYELYDFIRFALRQAVPNEDMDPAFIVKWAKFQKITQNPPAPAKGTVQFTGVNGSPIPQGTELELPNGTVFTTDAVAVIAAGIANVNITAKTSGVAGNAPNGSTLSLTEPLAVVDPDALVLGGGLAGGYDGDSIKPTLLNKLLDRGGQVLWWGQPGSYIAWATEVPGITRAWEIKNYDGLSTMGIVVVSDESDPIIPNDAKLTEVEEYVQKKTPYKTIIAIAPTLVPINIQIRLIPDTAQGRANVMASLESFFLRNDIFAPNSTLYISNIYEAISVADGEKSHDLIEPASNIVLGPTEVPVLGTVTFVA
jgi:uncharacterized phage protein gp47/JayE